MSWTRSGVHIGRAISDERSVQSLPVQITRSLMLKATGDVVRMHEGRRGR